MYYNKRNRSRHYPKRSAGDNFVLELVFYDVRPSGRSDILKSDTV